MNNLGKKLYNVNCLCERCNNHCETVLFGNICACEKYLCYKCILTSVDSTLEKIRCEDCIGEQYCCY